VKTIIVERYEEIGVSCAAGGRYFEILLMNLTEGREQVDAGNLGVNFRDGGLHMKKNVFQFGVLQKVLLFIYF